MPLEERMRQAEIMGIPPCTWASPDCRGSYSLISENTEAFMGLSFQPGRVPTGGAMCLNALRPVTDEDMPGQRDRYESVR